MALRFTIAETEGSQRAYSYLLSGELPLGRFPLDDELPEDFTGEIEALAQSDEAPSFLWEGNSELVITVEEV